MQPQDPAEIHLCFAITLKTTQNGASKDQKLGLIRRPPQAIREYIDRFGSFFQAVEEPGEVQPSLHVARLQLEQFAVGTNCRTRHGALRQIVGLLQPALRGALVTKGRNDGFPAAWIGAGRHGSQTKSQR